MSEVAKMAKIYWGG